MVRRTEAGEFSPMRRFLVAVIDALLFTDLAYSMCVTAEPVPPGRNAEITVLYDGKPQEHVKLTVTLPGGGSRLLLRVMT